MGRLQKAECRVVQVSVLRSRVLVVPVSVVALILSLMVRASCYFFFAPTRFLFVRESGGSSLSLKYLAFSFPLHRIAAHMVLMLAFTHARVNVRSHIYCTCMRPGFLRKIIQSVEITKELQTVMQKMRRLENLDP